MEIIMKLYFQVSTARLTEFIFRSQIHICQFLKAIHHVGANRLSFNVPLCFILYRCECVPPNVPLKMISLRDPEKSLSDPVCIYTCMNVRVHLCRLPLKKRKRPLSIEESASAAFHGAVSKPGLSEWEGRREGEDKGNGCKRFGSWYLALRRLKTLLGSIFVNAPYLATRVIVEGLRDASSLYRKILWRTNVTREWNIFLRGGISRRGGGTTWFNFVELITSFSSIAISCARENVGDDSWPCSLRQQ